MRPIWPSSELSPNRGRGNLSVDVLAPGTVTAAPNGEAVVTAHAAGTIVRLAKQLGDGVSVGETLAIVESREAASMAADRTVAESKAALARSALAREQELYNQRVTPRQDLERASAELAVADAEVQACARSGSGLSRHAGRKNCRHKPARGKDHRVSGGAGQFCATRYGTLSHCRPEIHPSRSIGDGDGCRTHRRGRSREDRDADQNEHSGDRAIGLPPL